MRMVLITMLSLGALAGVAWWLQQPPGETPPPVSTQDAPAALTRNPTPDQPPQPRRKPSRVTAAGAPAEASAAGPATPLLPADVPPPWPESEFTPEEYEPTKIPIFRAVQARSRDWTVETYARYDRDRDNTSGRDSYTVYAYLRSCVNQPRDAQSLTAREESINNNNRLLQRQGQEGIDRAVAQVRSGLVRCEGLPDDEALVPLMLEWLTQAALRGFPQAQHAYHHSVPWLLNRSIWGPYRHPERVHEYRRLAPLMLEAALQSGHADSFAEYSAALREGIIFDEDDQAAYAYAHAASLASHGTHREAEGIMAFLQYELTPEQLRDAREMGRALCANLCRTP